MNKLTINQNGNCLLKFKTIKKNSASNIHIPKYNHELLILFPYKNINKIINRIISIEICHLN